MTFEQWWAKEFSNVNIQWYENSSDALTKEWFNIVKQAFEDGKSSALAAKDARIAELEKGSGFRLMPGESLQTKTDINGRVISACIMAANGEPAILGMGGGQWALLAVAADSEDGRDDQPEVVAWFYPNPDGSLCMDAVRDNPDYPGAVAVMTVAQHKRIVAAMDAEIARLNDLSREALAFQQELIHQRDSYSKIAMDMQTERDEALAQLARQVGDAQIKNDSDALVIISRGVLAAAIYAIREKKDAPVIIEKLRKASIGDEVHYAALAPAAMVVMPTHKSTESGFDGQRTFSLGYNSALDEVEWRRRKTGELVLEIIESLDEKDAEIKDLECWQDYAAEVVEQAAQLLRLIKIDACDVSPNIVAVLRLENALKKLDEYDRWKTTPPHSCEEDGHSWKRVGQAEDGCTFYKCRECQEEMEN